MTERTDTPQDRIKVLNAYLAAIQTFNDEEMAQSTRVAARGEASRLRAELEAFLSETRTNNEAPQAADALVAVPPCRASTAGGSHAEAPAGASPLSAIGPCQRCGRTEEEIQATKDGVEETLRRLSE